MLNRSWLDNSRAMKQKINPELDKKVNHLAVKLRTNYPNLYNSIGWRYVRQMLRELYRNPSKRKHWSLRQPWNVVLFILCNSELPGRFRFWKLSQTCSFKNDVTFSLNCVRPAFNNRFTFVLWKLIKYTSKNKHYGKFTLPYRSHLNYFMAYRLCRLWGRRRSYPYSSCHCCHCNSSQSYPGKKAALISCCDN